MNARSIRLFQSFLKLSAFFGTHVASNSRKPAAQDHLQSDVLHQSAQHHSAQAAQKIHQLRQTYYLERRSFF